jgi:cation-transporting ATPase 13A2
MSTAEYKAVPVAQDVEMVESNKLAKVVAGDAPPAAASSFKHEWVKVSSVRLFLFYLVAFLSAGILLVVCVNVPLLKFNLISAQCTADEATMVRVFMIDGSVEYCPLEVHSKDGGVLICFELIATRYLASSIKGYEVSKVPAEPDNFSDVFVAENSSTTVPSRDEMVMVYGLNKLNLPIADTFTVLILEMLSPFYIFQYFAVAVWLATDYIAYSVIILIITAMSIYFVCSDKLYNIRRLHELADSGHTIEVTDRHGNDSKNMSDQLLVPGDCFIITQDMPFPCDAVLIRGKIVVDESMLTGESIPVTKSEFVHSSSSPDATKRKANLLYCGTKVKAIGTNEKPIAMVLRTGFRSSKGEIISTLARPPREIVSFMPDAFRAILFMVVITTAIFGWSADQLKRLGTLDADVVTAYLTALTIAVPPGLVACLSISTSVSVMRLAAKKISISDTMKLNAAAYISYAGFDKTGTLTDENILFKGVELFMNGQAAREESSDVHRISKLIMASCHSLSILNNEPVGDQLEMELFKVSGWTASVEAQSSLLQVQGGSSGVHTIARTFEYSPEKLRAGVVLRLPQSAESMYLLKGSPEIIISMCSQASVPTKIEESLTALAKQGFRVLAMAYRIISADSAEWSLTASQSELEEQSELRFLGLIYFQNKLKIDTWPRTINSLQQANIKVNMITGDHIFTAVAIAADCNILPKEADRALFIVDAAESGEVVITSEKFNSATTLISLIENAEKSVVDSSPTKIAVTGAALRSLQKDLFPELFNRLVRCTSVFARVKPDQKKLVVTELKKPLVEGGDPTYVMFCGDGANDMEALSVATVGVSLCDTATTVAASIVSLTQSPYSTVEVLMEGRCSLITAYVLVLFNIMYAIIQYFMTCFLNNIGLVFGDSMYIVQDLFFSFFLGLAISRTLPSEKLEPHLPPGRLFTAGLMLRLFVQLAIFPVFQYILLVALSDQSWYTKFDAEGDPLVVSWAPECSTLQILCLAQLMIASVVVTIGKPFRLPWYRNRIHLFVLLCQSAYLALLLFCRDHHIASLLQNYPVPPDFQGIIIGIIFANLATSAVFAYICDLIFPY